MAIPREIFQLLQLLELATEKDRRFVLVQIDAINKIYTERYLNHLDINDQPRSSRKVVTMKC